MARAQISSLTSHAASLVREVRADRPLGAGGSDNAAGRGERLGATISPAPDSRGHSSRSGTGR